MRLPSKAAAFLLLALCAPPALAAGPYGPPPPASDDGSAPFVAAGLHRREVKLSPRNEQYSPFVLKQNQFHLRVGESVGYGWRISGRAGGADADDGGRFVAGYRPFAGLALQGTLHSSSDGAFGVAALLRADAYAKYTVRNVSLGTGLPASVKVKDMWDAGAAVVAHWRVAPAWTTWGGPSYEYFEAKVYRETPDAQQKSYYRQARPLGLTGGAAWKRGDWTVSLEGAWTDRVSIGAEAGVSF